MALVTNIGSYFGDVDPIGNDVITLGTDATTLTITLASGTLPTDDPVIFTSIGSATGYEYLLGVWTRHSATVLYRASFVSGLQYRVDTTNYLFTYPHDFSNVATLLISGKPVTVTDISARDYYPNNSATKFVNPQNLVGLFDTTTDPAGTMLMHNGSGGIVKLTPPRESARNKVTDAVLVFDSSEDAGVSFQTGGRNTLMQQTSSGQYEFIDEPGLTSLYVGGTPATAQTHLLDGSLAFADGDSYLTDTGLGQLKLWNTAGGVWLHSTTDSLYESTAGIVTVKGTSVKLDVGGGAKDIATVEYVDSVAQGLDPKAATLIYLPSLVESNGSTTLVTSYSAGVLTITSPGGGGTDSPYYLAADGTTWTIVPNGAEVLINVPTGGGYDALANGIYTYSSVASHHFTRRDDADSSAKLTPGAYTFIEIGYNAGASYVLQPYTTWGTDALTFVKFNHITVSAAGSTNDVQFNNGGSFAVDTGVFTYSSSVLTAPKLTLGSTGTGTGNYVTGDRISLDSGGLVYDSTNLSTTGTMTSTTLTATTGAITATLGNIIATNDGAYVNTTAYKIGGTSVIDSSQNITVSGDITTSAGDLLLSAGDITLTNGSITATHASTSVAGYVFKIGTTTVIDNTPSISNIVDVTASGTVRGDSGFKIGPSNTVINSSRGGLLADLIIENNSISLGNQAAEHRTYGINYVSSLPASALYPGTLAQTNNFKFFTSGVTTLSTKNFTWDTDELSDASLDITIPDGLTFLPTAVYYMINSVTSQPTIGKIVVTVTNDTDQPISASGDIGFALITPKYAFGNYTIGTYASQSLTITPVATSMVDGVFTFRALVCGILTMDDGLTSSSEDPNKATFDSKLKELELQSRQQQLKEQELVFKEQQLKEAQRKFEQSKLQQLPRSQIDHEKIQKEKELKQAKFEQERKVELEAKRKFDEKHAKLEEQRKLQELKKQEEIQLQAQQQKRILERKQRLEELERQKKQTELQQAQIEQEIQAQVQGLEQKEDAPKGKVIGMHMRKPNVGSLR